MDENEQEFFYALVETARGQQQAVNTALAGLEKSKNELTKAAAALQEYGKQLVPNTGKAASEGATKAVNTALGNASQTAVDAVAESCQPLLAGLAGVEAQAEAAEGKLKDAVSWFGWRWAGVAGAISFGVVVAVYLICSLVVWHERSQLDDLKAERDKINAEMATAKTTLEKLTKHTGGVRYVEAANGHFILVPGDYEARECGTEKTPCIRLK